MEGDDHGGGRENKTGGKVRRRRETNTGLKVRFAQRGCSSVTVKSSQAKSRQKTGDGTVKVVHQYGIHETDAIMDPPLG